MRKLFSFMLTLVLLFGLVGCSDTKAENTERVYSFSGEIEEMRVINGVATIGSDTETFYGGLLELKTETFDSVTKWNAKFYISDEPENWTILNNVIQDETGTFSLKNQELGQITGPILNTNMKLSDFEENLYFKLEITDKNGNLKTYTIPMEVKKVISVN